MRAFAWGDGVQLAAQDLRLGQIAALMSSLGGSATNQLGVGSGVRHTQNSALFVATSSGLSVTVNPGHAIVQGTAAANSGAYACVLDATATLTCQTADLVNPRIDSVIVQVVDNGNNTSTATVNIQTGTPASSPTPPALPANSLLLCNITVPANATSLTGGNLADNRAFMAAAGGIQPWLSSANYPSAGPSSAYGHDLALGRLKWFNGTAVVAPKVAAFAPVSASGTSSIANSTTYQIACSATVTTDGNTPIRVLGDVSFFTVTGSVGTGYSLAILKDGTAVKILVQYITSAVGSLAGTSIWWNETPSAAAHTYAVAVATQGSGQIQAHNGDIIVSADSA